MLTLHLLVFLVVSAVVVVVVNVGARGLLFHVLIWMMNHMLLDAIVAVGAGHRMMLVMIAVCCSCAMMLATFRLFGKCNL